MSSLPVNVFHPAGEAGLSKQGENNCMPHFNTGAIQCNFDLQAFDCSQSPPSSDFSIPSSACQSHCLHFSSMVWSSSSSLESEFQLGQHIPEKLTFALDQLKSVESFYNPDKSVFISSSKNRSSIDHAHRDRAVSLIKDIHHAYFQLADNIFVISVSLFDRFIISVSIPCLCAKLVMAICYHIAAEGIGNKPSLLTRQSLLQLTGANSSYSLEDFLYWEKSVHEILHLIYVPLALATPLDYLCLLASGYGLTRQMVLLMSECLCHLSVSFHAPCVLAISVFYACIPKSEWDLWEYPGWFAARYGIGGKEFVSCIYEVMALQKRMIEDPPVSRVSHLLNVFRERGQYAKDNHHQPRLTNSITTYKPILNEIIEEF